MSTEELSSKPTEPQLKVLRELSTKIHSKLIELLTVFTKSKWWGMSDEATAHQKDVLDLVDKAIALGRFTSHSQHRGLILHNMSTMEEREWWYKGHSLYHYASADIMKSALEKRGTPVAIHSKKEIVETMLKSVDILVDTELLSSSMEDDPKETLLPWKVILCWEQIRTLCLLPLHFIQTQETKFDRYGHELHRLEQCLRRKLALCTF